MQTDFEQAESFEQRDVTPGLKIEPWRQFITAYGANNPFTDSDEQLRVRAQKRLGYWRQETQRRAEAQKQKQSTVSIEPETASVTQQQASPPPQAPADPKAEKLWKRYQLALKRNLPSAARKAAETLVNKHPNSDYAILLIAAKLREKIKNKELTEENLKILEEFRQRHPHHPETRGLLDEMLPKLLVRAEQHRTSKRFDSAEWDYTLARAWGADPVTVKKGLSAIRNKRVEALLKSGDDFIKQVRFDLATQKYDEAEQLGADPGLLSIKRNELKHAQGKFLIDRRRIEEAENFLLEWELSGFQGDELRTLNAMLVEKRISLKEEKALSLINQGLFIRAEEYLLDWELFGEGVSKIPEIYAYMEKYKKKVIKGRLDKINELIELEDYSSARENITSLEKSGNLSPEIEKLKKLINKKEKSLFDELALEPVTGMKFVWVPGGSFQMGDLFGEGSSDEKYIRTVKIKSFLLGETEVTQEQWEKIMGNNPSSFPGSDRPVDNVNWYETQQFIWNMYSRTGKQFRLPTEAEWEYACREGGRKVRYCNGKNSINTDNSHFDSNHMEGTISVGYFLPNSLGLFDMSGNVWEWTCSEWNDPYDERSEKCIAKKHTNLHGLRRSVRGGSWSNKRKYLRSANRDYYSPRGKDVNIGFRLAMDLP